MPRNGSGQYNPLTNTWNPPVTGVLATGADFQAQLNDISAAITQSVSKDGQTPMTANLPMGNNSIVGIASGTETSPSISANGDTNTGVYFPAADTVAIATGGVKRVEVDASGNLLVGTTAGGMQLGGNGTQGYYGSIFPSSRGIEHVNTAAAGSPRAYYFTTQNGGAYTSLNASAFNISSDYRLKENIQPLTGALDRLSLLKPSRFNYRADIETKMPYGENTVDGFVAHEVFDVVPEAVSGEKDALYDNGTINPQSLDASKLIPLLTAAIQEQQALIEAQKTAIESLTARITALEAK